DGNTIHSRYQRWSTHGNAAWTPNPDTRVELSGIVSDGRAAYADRMMDGTRFARRNAGLRFEKHAVSDRIDSIEANFYYNYVDHVMDNYSLRVFSPSMMMPNPTVSNPDRLTFGGRAAAMATND